MKLARMVKGDPRQKRRERRATESAATETPEPIKMPWALQGEEVCQLLKVNPGHGLEAGEARTRLALFGPNALPNPKDSLWEHFLEPFTEPMILLLFATLAIFALVGQFEDAAALFVIIVVVVAVEVVQEGRAKRAVQALERLGASTATLVRSGALSSMPAAGAKFFLHVLFGATD